MEVSWINPRYPLHKLLCKFCYDTTWVTAFPLATHCIYTPPISHLHIHPIYFASSHQLVLNALLNDPHFGPLKHCQLENVFVTSVDPMPSIIPHRIPCCSPLLYHSSTLADYELLPETCRDIPVLITATFSYLGLQTSHLPLLAHFLGTHLLTHLPITHVLHVDVVITTQITLLLTFVIDSQSSTDTPPFACEPYSGIQVSCLHPVTPACRASTLPLSSDFHSRCCLS